eukprot:CAMPEP_0201552090 /NCGR_PEP_ID=MMETSP0173_2-20130828/13675_1 /ASSEMBLY_ACC=CAM_ASM_000268 /TAXON_ID=218659 /ORGANISM="Vexillifera sp., Strain DIVA3 564/2" /LENGTH=213 /DNA_ID=CAMNT_0047962509 /DNA_START=26 /DNA_END=667 /DNA_ORIENTATION=-
MPKRGRKKRHPDEPKKPKTAYMIFAMEARPKIKEEFPDKKFGEISKICGERWKLLSDGDKVKYQEEYNLLKIQYQKDLAAFKETHPLLEEDDEDAKPAAKKQKVRKTKDPNRPKRPLSGFLIYSGEHRAGIKEKNPEASFGEMGKILGAQWKALSEDEKKPYMEKAAILKEEYLLKVKEYDEKKAQEEKDAAAAQDAAAQAAAAADDDDDDDY